MATDPYVVLKVAPTASPSEIRAAYDALARRCDPVFGPYWERPEILQQVGDAYATVGDSERRCVYDSHPRFSVRDLSTPRRAWWQPAPAADILEAARDFFRRGKALANRGNFRRARQAFETALLYVPSLPEGTYNIGLMYYKVGGFEAARSAFSGCPLAEAREFERLLALPGETDVEAVTPYSEPVVDAVDAILQDGPHRLVEPMGDSTQVSGGEEPRLYPLPFSVVVGRLLRLFALAPAETYRVQQSRREDLRLFVFPGPEGGRALLLPGDCDSDRISLLEQLRGWLQAAVDEQSPDEIQLARAAADLLALEARQQLAEELRTGLERLFMEPHLVARAEAFGAVIDELYP
ncbi:MAG: J domain-containing protein [Candidatus Xenobia bacterium]